jgi:hypothetical protein
MRAQLEGEWKDDEEMNKADIAAYYTELQYAEIRSTNYDSEGIAFMTQSEFERKSEIF